MLEDSLNNNQKLDNILAKYYLEEVKKIEKKTKKLKG